MDHALDRLARTILEHAADYPWRINDLGLLALRLDDDREYRLHVWDPDGCLGDPPIIHDHPYDFSSRIVVGELTDTRYVEDPGGVLYRRERYAPSDEHDRRRDTVRLTGASTTRRAGQCYQLLAEALHASDQTRGTVTLIRCAWRERPELTVCLRPDARWLSGQARPATADEIKRISAAALDRFRTA